MRRKEYRERWPVTLSVEKDRWRDFEDLCDKERKSLSLKISEMLEKELQKNAFGEETPIKIRYGKGKNNPFPFQMRLDAWTTRVAAVENIKDMDAQLIENIGLNMIYASRFKKTGIARDVRVY